MQYRKIKDVAAREKREFQMIVKRNKIIPTLKDKGTLKTETIKLTKINPKDRSFYQAQKNIKRIDKRVNMIRVYEVCYKNYLSDVFNKNHSIFLFVYSPNIVFLFLGYLHY